MIKRRDQSRHDSMVKSIAEYLTHNGHSNIKADNIGYELHTLICWENTIKAHIPDITSFNDTQYIFEIETDDSILDSHTEDQWKLFSENAQQDSKKFIVVVPKGYEWQARARAKRIGATITDVWTVD